MQTVNDKYKYNMNTPVAIFFFKRPDKLMQIIKKLELLKPINLYCVCDGPQENYTESQKLAIVKCKEIIANISWKCSINKNYSDVNLGCKLRIESGLDWIFNNVDKCIILEDDCNPDISFFAFCTYLLNEYENKKNISMISGNNFIESINKSDNKYFFSRYSNIWGWATWADRWKIYRENNKLSNQNPIKKINSLDSLNEYLFWLKIIIMVKSRKLNTWDYSWTIYNLNCNRLSIVPSVNLVENIGFDNESTHTFNDSYYLSRKTKNIFFPLISPSEIKPNSYYDNTTANIFYKLITLIKLRLLFKNYV